MTARDASVYRCQQCGFASAKAGTCPDCLRAGAGWVQLVEERPRPARGKRAPPVLYVTAEESAAQVKMRADRLGVASDRLLLLAETDLSVVQTNLDDVKPRGLVVDSIQTVFLPDLESAPGSVAQVRECGARLMTLAKGRSIATFLVGHVTKEGAIAGPRVLEHLVDTVL